jgi:membrane fusion protein, heavy metal efflux system
MTKRTCPTALLLTILLTSCGGAGPVGDDDDHDDTPDLVLLSPEQMRAGGIQIAAIDGEPLSARIDAPAVLKLDQQRTARVGARVDAVVEAVHRDVGDLVRPNALLATLHSHVTHDAVAALRTAISEIARLEGELAFARQTRERFGRLLEDGAASRQEVERAETAVGTLERQIEAAQAEQTRARSELAHFGIQPDRVARPDPQGHPADQIPVRTPVAGVVLERLVTPGTAVTSGQPLFVISDLSRLWAVAEFDERHVAALTRGRTATVTVAAYPAEVFTGTVTYVGDIVDPVTRRISVRAELANTDQRLKPEMFGTLSLPGPEQSALVVPADAVQRLDDHDVVFVEEAPGRLVPVRVRVSDAGAGRAVVDEGLGPGARVVVRGAFLVKSELQKAMLAEEP